MPIELFSRELKSEPLTVKTAQILSRFEVNRYQVMATYAELKKLSDGTDLTKNTFTVSRSLATIEQDVADWLAQGAAFIETWRQQDEDEAAAQKAIADAAIAAAAIP